jgi:pimeloyl-ACP methyl ester carboxylesterase
MFRERTFVAGRVVINCAEGPDSGPPLLFLHGIAGSWPEYEPFFRRFAPAWHVYACDLRGHGRSDRAGGAYRLADYVADTVALLRRWIREPSVLVGHSLGAMTALGAAAAVPAMARALVLLDPPLPAGELRMAEYPDLAPFLAWMRDQAASARSVDEVAAAYREAAPGADEAGIRREAWSIFRVAPEALDAALDDRLVADFDVRGALARAECPVLVLRGDPERGAVLRDEEAAFVRAALPGAAVVGIPGAGHMLHAEQPEPVLRHVDAFLEPLRARSGGQATLSGAPAYTADEPR